MSGVPEPNVTWFSNTTGTEVMLSSATNGIVIEQLVEGELVTSTLKLDSPTRYDAGQYICSSTNELGTVTVTGTLRVLCK